MTEIGYKVKIVKDNFQFEVEGDKSFVREMLSQFASEIPQITPTPGKARSKSAVSTKIDPETTNKPLSISEFVRGLEVKQHTDIVLAFGYYLEKYFGSSGFTPADINNCYYDAKMENSNTSQMIIQNIRRSRIMEAQTNKNAKGKKKYILTATGEKFIRTKLANIEK